jgi:arginase family enzyme
MSNIVTNHFINVKLQQITAKKHIKDEFDYEISDLFYEKTTEAGVPIVYNFLYRYILQNIPKNNRVITMSPDPLISTSTIVGLAEKYMYTEIDNFEGKECLVFKSNLKVVYFTAQPHLSEEVTEVSLEQLTKMTLANALCSVESTITGHKLALSPDQFVLIGLNTDILDESQKDELAKSNIKNYTLQQIRKKKMRNIIRAVNNFVGDNPVHLIFDMSCMSLDIAPCVTRFVDFTKHKTIDGFIMKEIEEAMTMLNKTNLVGFDITGYDLRIERSERAFRVTCEVPRRLLQLVLGIKEKKLNIFNEHSKFLIWRPIDQEEETDVGWFILRNIPLDTREQLIEHIGTENIISFQTEDDDGEIIDAYVTVTTMAEQQERTYCETTNVHDCVLYPAQKVYAMFELLNTGENKILEDENNQI